MGMAIDQFGQAGVGLHGHQAGPVGRQPTDVLGHFLRAGGAVQAHQRHVQRADDGGGGGDVGADQQRAGWFRQ